MARVEESASDINIWDSDIPELVFAILDFLWNAKPHLDQSRLKSIQYLDLGFSLSDWRAFVFFDWAG